MIETILRGSGERDVTVAASYQQLDELLSKGRLQDARIRLQGMMLDQVEYLDCMRSFYRVIDDLMEQQSQEGVRSDMEYRLSDVRDMLDEKMRSLREYLDGPRGI